MWAYASVRWRRGLDHRRPTLDGLVESGRGRVFTAAEPLDQLADVKAVTVVAAPTPLRVSNALRTPLWHVAGAVYQGAFFRGMTGGVPLRAFGVALAIAASGRTGLAFAGAQTLPEHPRVWRGPLCRFRRRGRPKVIVIRPGMPSRPAKADGPVGSSVEVETDGGDVLRHFLVRQWPGLMHGVLVGV